MALTATEEAQVRLLLDEQAAILSLAGNEATITSKLGATKVTLSDLGAASVVNDADLILARQGTDDKSMAALLLKNYTLSGVLTQAQADARYVGIGYMLVQDQKPNGTSGGASVVGTQTRDLNTVVVNTIAGASLATNQITLPSGTYRVKARTPIGSANGNQSLFVNITDTITYFGSSNDGETLINSHSFLECRFSIASAKVFELQHWIFNAIGDGLGYPSITGISSNEIYSSVEIFKES